MSGVPDSQGVYFPPGVKGGHSCVSLRHCQQNNHIRLGYNGDQTMNVLCNVCVHSWGLCVYVCVCVCAGGGGGL